MASVSTALNPISPEAQRLAELLGVKTDVLVVEKHKADDRNQLPKFEILEAFGPVVIPAELQRVS